MKSMKKTSTLLFILITSLFQTNGQSIESIKLALIGEWIWYGSGGGLAGQGFNGPVENSYTVTVKIENDLLSDSLLFWNYVNDSIANQGKASVHLYENSVVTYEINSVLPSIHDSYFTYPVDSNRYIHFEFLNDDSVRFYHAMCADCFEVYYKRTKITGTKRQHQIKYGITFFPNPSKGLIAILNPGDHKIKEIELIDLAGRMIQKWQNFHPTENMLDIQHIFRGVYLLKITTEAGIKTEKLIVQ